jgi:hypothetical protein
MVLSPTKEQNFPCQLDDEMAFTSWPKYPSPILNITGTYHGGCHVMDHGKLQHSTWAEPKIYNRQDKIYE